MILAVPLENFHDRSFGGVKKGQQLGTQTNNTEDLNVTCASTAGKGFMEMNMSIQTLWHHEHIAARALSTARKHTESMLTEQLHTTQQVNGANNMN